MYTDLLSINKFFKKIISLKKPKAMLLASCFFISGFNAQVNYLPNPSFEKLIGYDGNFIENPISVAVPWDTIQGGWGGGHVAIVPSPSINLFGEILYQVARTGNFMGLMDYNVPPPSFNSSLRGYMRSPLLYSLKANKRYCVTAYFNLVNDCQYASDELSLYFDNGSLVCTAKDEYAIANAQIKSPTGVFYADTLNWMKVQGTFIANGTESYVTIGNFKLPANSTSSLVYPGATHGESGYYIDDVSVIEADLPTFAGRDTLLCVGDSVFLGRPPEIGLECLWFNNGSQVATGGGLWVKPSTTQTYLVQQDVCGLIKTDTVQVQIKPKYIGNPIVITNSTIVCPTDVIKLSIQNPPPGDKVKYDWLPAPAFTNTTNLSAQSSINQTTNFTVNIHSNGEDSFCPFVRTGSVSVSVPQYTGTASLLLTSSIVCPNDTIFFTLQNAPFGNGIKYTWLPLGAYTNTLNLSAKTLPGLLNSFTLNVISPVSNGFCSFTRTVSVDIPDSCFKTPQIPNIFTPNNDDVNDVWQIKFPYGYSLKELEIYNRWGTLIYAQNNLSFDKQNLAVIGWDGRTDSGQECSTGVYFYVLKYMDRNSEMKAVKGNISLIR